MNHNFNDYTYINVPPDEFGAKWNLMQNLISENKELAEKVDNTNQISAIPTAEIIEHNSYFLLEVELPGFKQSNIHVELDDFFVKISAKKHRSTDHPGALCFSERNNGYYEREITFPCDINVSKVEANYGNGLLSLTLPKKQETQIRPVKIKFIS